jgi:anti-sigma B factor antagonist
VDEFRCDTQRVGDRIGLVVLAGELDLHTSKRVRAAVQELRAAGADCFVIDLAAVTFVDSTGLGTLVRTQHKSAAPLHLVVAGDAVQRPLRMTALDKIFRVYADRHEALEALGAQLASR